MSNETNDTKQKDTMIKFKGVDMRKNSKGGDFITLKLSPEGLEEFVTELKQAVTERGVKVDIHISDRDTEDGRTFKSGIAFCKGIQEFGAARGFGGAGKATNNASTAASTRSKIEALKAGKSS